MLLGMDVLGQAEELVIDYAAPALWVRFAAVERQSPPARAPRLRGFEFYALNRKCITSPSWTI